MLPAESYGLLFDPNLDITLLQRPLNPVLEKPTQNKLQKNVLFLERGPPPPEENFSYSGFKCITKHTFGTKFVKFDQAVEAGQRSKQMGLETPQTLPSHKPCISLHIDFHWFYIKIIIIMC